MAPVSSYNCPAAYTCRAHPSFGAFHDHDDNDYQDQDHEDYDDDCIEYITVLHSKAAHTPGFDVGRDVACGLELGKVAMMMMVVAAMVMVMGMMMLTRKERVMVTALRIRLVSLLR